MVAYWPKHYQDLVEEVSEKRFRVTEVFAAYATWRTFRSIVSQRRRLVTEYDTTSYRNVVTYEFYLPLRHEAALKSTLDSLFYKDIVEARIANLEIGELRRAVQFEVEEPDDAAFRALVRDFVDSKFGGYSTYHVNGRFKAGKLKTQAEVASATGAGQRYLVDETTAVARFIFPCDEREANSIEYLFERLFVRSITLLVAGEDEIWMVESGQNDRVHVWKTVEEDGDEDEDEDGEADPVPEKV